MRALTPSVGVGHEMLLRPRSYCRSRPHHPRDTISLCVCVYVCGRGIQLPRIVVHRVTALHMSVLVCVAQQRAGVHHRSLQPTKTLPCMLCRRTCLLEKVDMGFAEGFT